MRGHLWASWRSVAGGVSLFAALPFAIASASGGRPEIVWMRGGHSAATASLAYSPDGAVLATANADWTVKIWRVSDRQLLRTLIPFGAPCSDVAFSPRSGLLAVNSHYSSSLRIYETTNYTTVTNIESIVGGFDRLAFSPQGDWLVLGEGFGGLVEFFRTHDWSRARVFEEHGEDVEHSDFQFSSDGEQLLVAEFNADEPTLFLWSMTESRVLWSTNDPGESVGPAVFSPGGEEILWGVEGALHVRSVADGALLRTLDVSNVVAAVFSPDAKSVAFASYTANLEVWDWPTGQLRYLLGLTWGNERLTFSPDGRFLTGSAVNVWRVDDGQPQRGFNQHRGRIEKIVFSPDHSLLASGGSDHTVCLWRVATGERVAVFQQADPITALAFSPDSSLIVASGSFDLVGLRSTNGTLVRNLNHPPSGVGEAAFSPDGRFVAVEFEGGAAVFDVNSGQPTTNGPSLESFKLGRRDTVSSDGSWFASYRPCSISPPCGLLLQGQSLEPSWDPTPRAMTFAPDGGTLLVAGSDPTLKFWGTTSFELAQTYAEEVAGGAPLRLIDDEGRGQGAWAGVTAVTYSRNGQYFAYGRVDGTVVLARNQFFTPVQMSASATPDAIRLSWGGGNRFYQLQRRRVLTGDEWEIISPPITTTNAFVQPDAEGAAFYRVQNLGN